MNKPVSADQKIFTLVNSAQKLLSKNKTLWGRIPNKVKQKMWIFSNTYIFAIFVLQIRF